jgi:predicted phage terminase large subunit-like protein
VTVLATYPPARIRTAGPFAYREAARAASARGPEYEAWFRGTLPPSWTVPEHVRLINEHLAAVERGEIDRLAIHMPPRHGKSESVTIRFPLRWIERRPGDNVLVTGYNERFARKFSRRIRNMAAERSGGKLVAADKSAADEWATSKGGLVMARGVGNPPTGTGFNLIVIDDPIRRREDAESEAYREKTWDWYTDDLYNRLEPGAPLILVMTLWHEDDIGARAVAAEPGRWTVLRLPAISDEGAALWPDRYPVASLERIRDVMAQNEGLRSWEALYQQNPTPREGSVFDVSELRYVDAASVPKDLARCRAWDLAATGGGGDYTAGVLMGRGSDGLTYVLDVVRGQWESAERNRRMKLTAEQDGPSVRVRLPQDPGQAGKEQAGALTRMFAGYPVRVLPVSGDKAVRADPFAAQVGAGNVRLLRGTWNAAFVEELRAFPAGRHDDMVDAAADAFNDLVPRPSWAGAARLNRL